MGSIRKRIYLGNLPFDASEEEVTKKFNRFGKVVNVEMKYQSDVSFDVGLPCYAFLDLDISDNDLNSCFSRITSKKWRGNLIKIEIAKESFLSRLEKERQTNKSIISPIATYNPIQIAKVDTSKRTYIKFDDNEVQEENPLSSSNNFTENSSNVTSLDEETDIPRKRKKAKKSREMEESNSTAEIPAEPTVIDKFESFSDVWRDEPTNESEPNYSQKKDRKQKERGKGKKEDSHLQITGSDEKLNKERNRIAEERRLKSLEDRQHSVKQQKDAVKLALSSVDSNKKNNRLTFNDGNDIDEPPYLAQDTVHENKHVKQANKKRGLFADDNSSNEDEEEISFAVKKQFEGSQGQKLLELKSKYGNDNRFALDERFYDGDNDKEGGKTEEMSSSEEVKRQLEILKGIVGENLPRGPKKVNTETQKPGENVMVRFDPTVVAHRKFVLSNEDKLTAVAPVQKEKKRKREPEPPPVEVSKEKYYKVADTLKESLKANEGTGFSLLEMFGGNKDLGSDKLDKEMGTKPVSLAEETGSRDRKSKRPHLDSVETQSIDGNEPKPTAKVESASTGGSWGETFFYKPDDPRLFEGIKFFKTMSDDVDFRQLRYDLRDICKHKVETARKKANESRGSGWHSTNGRRAVF